MPFAARFLSGGIALPVLTLCRRELTRFFRQRSRVIGACVQPLVFWVLVGAGFRASFRPPGLPEGTSYAAYAYPGIIAMVLLFTAIFATISVVEDRRAGFLQGVLVAPVSRTTIVLGQALGCTVLAVIQGLLFLVLAPAAGVPLSVRSVLAVTGVMALVAFGLSNLGLAIAWRLDSTQGFHAIMNLVLLPMWILSGAFYPTGDRWTNPSPSITGRDKTLYFTEEGLTFVLTKIESETAAAGPVRSLGG